jgi:hypothetical protein
MNTDIATIVNGCPVKEAHAILSGLVNNITDVYSYVLMVDENCIRIVREGY